MATVNRLLSSLVTLGLFTGSLLGGAAGAAEVPYWPSEQEQRLSELDARVLDTMRALSAARLRNEPQEVERLGKDFKQIQDERAALLRATGKLPPSAPR